VRRCCRRCRTWTWSSGPTASRTFRDAAGSGGGRAAVADGPGRPDGPRLPAGGPAAESGPAAFLTIMKGCDRFCAYCIVPHVRGREVSKPLPRVLDEVRALVAAGVREVTLLGQNVNAWGRTRPAARGSRTCCGASRRCPGWPPALRHVPPADADDRMLDLFGHLRNLAEYLHLPVQSGSDACWRACGAGTPSSSTWTACAGCGAPAPTSRCPPTSSWASPARRTRTTGRTLALVEEAQFDLVFSFKYSPRPGTVAARMPTTCRRPRRSAAWPGCSPSRTGSPPGGCSATGARGGGPGGGAQPRRDPGRPGGNAVLEVSGRRGPTWW